MELPLSELELELNCKNGIDPSSGTLYRCGDPVWWRRGVVNPCVDSVCRDDFGFNISRCRDEFVELGVLGSGAYGCVYKVVVMTTHTHSKHQHLHFYVTRIH